MHLRSFGWHHYYLALGLLSGTLCLVFLLVAPRYVLPLAVAVMALFSASALVNAYVDRRGDGARANADPRSFDGPPKTTNASDQSDDAEASAGSERGGTGKR